MPRPATPMVGRRSELATLGAALRGSAAGASAALVVGGDAGVGKTRLLTELVTLATEQGARCLVGHCVDLGDTPPPYLPFSEAFTRIAGEEPEVADRLVARFPALARLIRGHGADERIALLLYGYSRGLHSSRQLARACEERVDVMAVTGLTPAPSPTFASAISWVLSDLFVQMLRLCRAAGLVEFARVAVDGTEKANASRHSATGLGLVWSELDGHDDRGVGLQERRCQQRPPRGP